MIRRAPASEAVSNGRNCTFIPSRSAAAMIPAAVAGSRTRDGDAALAEIAQRGKGGAGGRAAAQNERRAHLHCRTLPGVFRSRTCLRLSGADAVHSEGANHARNVGVIAQALRRGKQHRVRRAHLGNQRDRSCPAAAGRFASEAWSATSRPSRVRTGRAAAKARLRRTRSPHTATRSGRAPRTPPSAGPATASGRPGSRAPRRARSAGRSTQLWN